VRSLAHVAVPAAAEVRVAPGAANGGVLGICATV
jgi:hypothetical protein